MMRFLLKSLLFVSLLSTFMSCKNDASTQKKDPSVSIVPKGFYKHYRGTIGTFPITMDLVQTIPTRETPAIPHFSGYYSYDKYEEPLPIYGTIDSNGTIQLQESGRGEASGFFSGKMDANGSFTGNWNDTTKKVSLPFMLKETADDGAIAMDIFPFEDSVKLFTNAVNSPQAEFTMDVALPAKNTEDSLFDFLRTQIIKTLKGDSIMADYNKLQISDVQKSARDSFFNNYKEMLKDEKQDSSEMQGMLNHAQSTDVEIVSNARNLLTLGFRDYAYTGGAHGNYGTRLMTFDLKNKKIMRLDDVFKPNYQKTLNAALNRSARRYFKLKPNESLSGSTFEAEIQANDNFAVGQRGILFNYPPYEIASYAQGEIQLFVPFDELKSILK